MSDNKIEFVEDPAKFRPVYVQDKIEGRSIEAWVYKKFPGTMRAKRFALIIIAVILFGFSIFFILLSYMGTNEEAIKQDLQKQIQNTQLR